MLKKYMKYFYIILTLIISLTFFVGCGQISEEQYNKLESDFYSAYDPIAKDFYSEALKVSNGQEKLSDLLDINHGRDIDKLNQLLNVNINNIPEDKKEDYKKISNACKQLVSLKIYSSVPYSNDSKDKIISLCKDFINFNKDRLNKLGINDN